ncbi:MAG: DUF3363 domain-containing protein [Alphaproteobacteria bacterium]|nr:DUF3363 domain-containing protein [Alphaproteobacteria bacterium]
MAKDTPTQTAGEDRFRVRLGSGGGGREGASKSASARLTKLKAAQRGRLFGRNATPFDGDGDRRQRVIVKASFHAHGGGGGGRGGGLSAHAGYLERDGAGKDGERGQFYDQEHDVAEDAHGRMRDWAEEDPRHFRLMIGAERGDLLPDQREFTRELMAQMERDLGVELEWVAVDHHNTDNAHTHVILRGVRGDGVALVIPKAYISHGLREAAREIATQHIGERTPADDRLRLERELTARGWTRLDQQLEAVIGEDRVVRLQALERDALRARAGELARIGLAEETRRNELRFAENWREQLEAQGPIDVKRELTRGRVYEPRMGRLDGVVERAGPRGEHGERGVLVIDTAEHGRVLLNTSRDAVDGLVPGDLVRLEPSGRRPEVQSLSDRPVQEQTRSPEYTDLDRALDQVAHYGRHTLPDVPAVRRALEARATHLARSGLGARDREGVFRYRDGAREDLAQAERTAFGRDAASRSGRALVDPTQALDQSWKLEREVDLSSGRVGVFGRGGSLTVVPMGQSHGLEIGDRVRLEITAAMTGHQAITAVKDLSKGLGLDR